jgi:hypothetical protein
MVLWGVAMRASRQLDDLVAHRPFAPAGPAGAQRSARVLSGTQRSRCSSTTSSHWRCLRPPRARRRPARSRPPRWRPMEVSLWPAMRAISEWNPWAEARTRSSARRALPDPLAPLGPVDVDRVLRRGRIPRPLAEGRERAEAQDDLAVGPDPAGCPRVRGPGGHQGRMDPAVLQDPGVLFGRTPGHHVEGVRALEDLDVVDSPDGLGVGQLGQSDPHAPMVLLTCGNQGSGGSSVRAVTIIDRFAEIPAAPLSSVGRAQPW